MPNREQVRRNVDPTYAQTVLAMNPVDYWRLGEPSGTNAVDLGSVPHAGTYVGSPTLGAVGLLGGDSDTAVTFDGSAKSVTFGDLGIGFGAARTVVVWAKQTNQTNAGYVFTLSASGGLIEVQASGTGLRIFDGSSNLDFAVAVSANVVHLIAASYDGTNWRMSLDGAPFSAPQAGSAVNTSAARLGSFGGSDASNFVGTLDETAVWTRALTDPDIANLYRIGRGF